MYAGDKSIDCSNHFLLLLHIISLLAHKMYTHKIQNLVNLLCTNFPKSFVLLAFMTGLLHHTVMV